MRPKKPKLERPIRLVCFDLDGVLIEAKSSWVAVHEAFGVQNEASLAEFLHGRISEEEFIRRDVALWLQKKPDAHRDDIDRILAGVVLHPGAKDTIRALHAANVHTAIVSGGIALAARRVAERLAIPHVSANELLTHPDGRLTGEGVVNTPLRDKSRPVRGFAAALDIPLEQVASVGNSAPDIPMFWASGLGIAFDPMDEATRKEADVRVEGRDLRDLLPFLLGDPKRPSRKA